MAVSSISGEHGVEVTTSGPPDVAHARSDEMTAARRLLPYLRRSAAGISHNHLKLWVDCDRQYWVAQNLGELDDGSGRIPVGASDEFEYDALIINEGGPAVAAGGGRRFLSFDGTPRRMVFGSLAHPLDFVHVEASSIYFVCSRNPDIDGHVLMGDTAGNATGFDIYANDNDSLGFDILNGTDFVLRATAPAAAGAMHVVSLITSPENDDPTSRCATYVDGAGPTTDNVWTTAVDAQVSPNPFNLGGDPGGFTKWQGEFCELLIYNDLHGDAQRQQVEAYLTWKWGQLM